MGWKLLILLNKPYSGVEVTQDGRETVIAVPFASERSADTAMKDTRMLVVSERTVIKGEVIE